jgi:uncharacterized protein
MSATPKTPVPDKALLDRLDRLVAALERMAPARAIDPEFDRAEAFVWQAHPEAFLPVPHINRQPLQLLKGIERAADQLMDNTRRFANGLSANNALLWGARGMGKSSLVKAAHAEVRKALVKAKAKHDLKLIELHREDIETLPQCLAHMRAKPHRFILRRSFV